MLIIAIIQVVVGIDIALIFDFLIKMDKRYLPIMCAMYPNIMGAIKAVMETINEKFELEFKYEIQFL
jgi:small basic protein